MTENATITLDFGCQSASVAPAIGGALAGYTMVVDGARIPLLRETPETGTALSVLDHACFPLVPYSSRIRHGRFRFGSREVLLPLNFGAHPHSIHGHGWQCSWMVVTQKAHKVTLHYKHAPDAWPWAYRASQTITLDDNGLSLELSVTNLADSAMPIGLGFHPYFPRARAARLKANVSSFWLMDDDVMPVECVKLPASLDLPNGVALADSVLDNGFEGWDGIARIDWPASGIGLDLSASPLLSRLVVYAPAGQDFFCVEPVSHMTDAFNRAAGGAADTGMHVLAPGETLTAWMRLSPRGL